MSFSLSTGPSVSDMEFIQKHIGHDCTVDLKLIHPRSDVIALLAMSDRDVYETLAACRILYNANRQLKRPGGALATPISSFERHFVLNVQEILQLRARYETLPEEERMRLSDQLEDEQAPKGRPRIDEIEPRDPRHVGRDVEVGVDPVEKARS